MYSTAYKRYVLAALTLVNTLNYLDGVVIVLVLQPIKADLQLSDSKLGFLTGIAFAFFYATLGLPIARWADRGNRSTIASLAIGLWGATVMSCLFVTSFAQLAIARIAAGVGEAGCMPPTYSLLGDYFPEPAERTRAMTIYWLSGSLASLIGFILGGLLNEHYGWRMTFFIIGTPGLLAAVVVKLTVRDPRSRAMPGPERVPRPPSLVEVLSTLWRQRSARHLSLAIISLWMMAAGLAPWYAAFMMRSHGMGTAELGLWLGLICGCGATAGTLLGGYIVGRFFPGNEPAQMRFSAVSIVSVVPCFVLFLLLPHKRQALMALAPLMIVFNIFLGPTFALLQRLVVAEMRATTLAVVMLLSNLIGMGVGPQIVGLLSDALTPTFGTDSLRVAMLIVSFVAMWSAWHFWQVGKTVKDDLQSLAARANSSAQPSGLHEVVLQP